MADEIDYLDNIILKLQKQTDLKNNNSSNESENLKKGSEKGIMKILTRIIDKMKAEQ